MAVLWIFRKKGNKSRAEWRNYENRKSKNQSFEEWRNEFQVKREISPPKLVKDASNPFPRLISIPEYGKTVKIVVKGRENEKDLIEGNIVNVNEELREADFLDFKIRKSSYNDKTKTHEGLILIFEVFDINGSILSIYETTPIQIVAHSKQLEMDESIIMELIPSQGVIYQQHKVIIYGEFRSDTTMKVFFGQEAKPFEWKNEEFLIASSISSNIPGQVPVYIQIKNKKSNEVSFTFFNPTQLGQQMGLDIKSSEYSPSTYNTYPNNSYDSLLNSTKHQFILNDGQITTFPITNNCSYPVFFFKLQENTQLEM